MSLTPGYWDEACKHLAKRDRVMRKLIPKFGEARLHCRGDAFTTLARSIVGQQISVAAAQTAWRSLRRAAGTHARPSPWRHAEVLALDTSRHARGGALGPQGRVPA